MLNSRLLFLCAVAALPALCVETRFWQQGEFADFEKGNLKKLSMRSDGRLTLAPATTELLDSSTPYLWAVAQDSKGNIYAGGGGPTASTSKLFQVDPQGKWKAVAELEGMEIHAIAIDSKDRVYAATAPDGKVYRITNGKSEVFFDPKAKYIWALTLGRNGDLFVATGDRGEIYRVTPDGKGSVFFQTEETHARSMTLDRDGNLIVGTEPSGLVLRVTPAGQGFVLYQTPKREVTAVVVGADGSVYAAAVGTRTSTSLPTPTTAPATAAPAPSAAGGIQVTVAPARAASAPPPTLAPAAVSGGSDVYRIYPDGSPRRVWTNAQDVVYALALDRDGKPVIGTGNKGMVYRIDSDITYTLLVNLPPTQVTGFASGRDGAIYGVTGNIGKLYRIGPGFEKEGTFESESFDAGAFTYWGRLTYTGQLNGGQLAIQSRSGNVSYAQKNWSSWTDVPVTGDGGRLAAPAARFVQYKLTLDSGPDGKSPEVAAIEVAYQSKNLPPVIREIEATPANYKSTASVQLTANTPPPITLPAIGQKRVSPATDTSGSSSLSLSYAKGHVGVRWSASDENGDTLIYKVEIRGANETAWKLLKDKVHDRYITWDSTAFPDGKYYVRVTASDAPSNPPADALETNLTSDAFYIDNTPPQVTGLAGSVAGGTITVQWKAKDAISVVEKAEYSLDGGDWTVVQPVTRLSDATELDFKLVIERAGPGEHTVAVRVTDEYENQSVEKVVVR